MANEIPGIGYEPEIWVKNEAITEDNMNHIENGIKGVYDLMDNYLFAPSSVQKFNAATLDRNSQLYNDGLAHNVTEFNSVTSDYISIYVDGTTNSSNNYKLGYIDNSGTWRLAQNQTTSPKCTFGYVLYDKNKNPVGPEGAKRWSFAQDGTLQFDVTDNKGDVTSYRTGTAYVRFSIWTESLEADFPSGIPDKLVFCQYQKNVTAYEPFYGPKGDYFVTTQTFDANNTNITNEIANAIEEVYTTQINLYDYSTRSLDTHLGYQTGKTASNAQYDTSYYIPVIPGKYVQAKAWDVTLTSWKNNPITAYAFYNNNQTFISGGTSLSTAVLVPTNAKYMRFEMKKSVLNCSPFTTILLQNDTSTITFPASYEPHYKFHDELITEYKLAEKLTGIDFFRIHNLNELEDAIENDNLVIYLMNDITLESPLTFTKDLYIYGNGHTIDCNKVKTASDANAPGIYIKDCTVRMYGLTVWNASGGVIKVGAAASDGNEACGGVLIADRCHFYRGEQVLVLSGFSKAIITNSDLHSTRGVNEQYPTSVSTDVVNVHNYAQLYMNNCKVHEGYDEGISCHDYSYGEILNTEVYNCGYNIQDESRPYTARLDKKGALSSYGGIHIGGARMGIVKGCYSHDNATYGIGLYCLAPSNSIGATICCNNRVTNNGKITMGYSSSISSSSENYGSDAFLSDPSNNCGGIIIYGVKNLTLNGNVVEHNYGYPIRVGIDDSATAYISQPTSSGCIFDNTIQNNYANLTQTAFYPNTVQVDSNADGGIYLDKNIWDVKTNYNGYYPELTAGQLATSDTHKNEIPYSARETYSDDYTYDRVRIERLIGCTIIWNQLISNGNFSDSSNPFAGWAQQNLSLNNSATVANRVCSFTAEQANAGIYHPLIPTEPGHIYLLQLTIRTNNPETIKITSVGSTYQEVVFLDTTEHREGIISQATDFDDAISIIAENAGVTVSVKDVILTDLTKMFGAEVATGALALGSNQAMEWFRKMFTNYYYTYQLGKMISVNPSARLTYGFNLFDKTNIIKGITNSQGEYHSDITTAYTSTELIPLFPGMAYQYNFTAVPHDYDDQTYPKVIFYDGQKQLLSASIANSVTTPQSACYCRVNVLATEINTATICVLKAGNENIYQSYINYQRYPIDERRVLYGIPSWKNNNLVYDGDKYFPDGRVFKRYRYLNFEDIPYEEWEISGSTASYTVTDSKIKTNNPKFLSTVNVNLEGNTIVVSGFVTDQSTGRIKGEIVYELVNETIIERARPYTEIQGAMNGGTEGFLDASVDAGINVEVLVPVGHVSYYQIDLRGELETMIASAEQITGTEVTINGIMNKRYHCGTLTSLTINPPLVGIIDIIFTTGSTPTILNANGIIWPDVSYGETPTLEPNRIYELNIMDGKYGVMTSWPALQN